MEQEQILNEHNLAESESRANPICFAEPKQGHELNAHNKQEYPPMHTDGTDTSITDDLYGDIHKIDISYTLEDKVYLVLVCAGYIDGEPNIQKTLLDKMEGYLNHILSDWFKQEYAGLKAIVVVCFDEEPHQLILQLLTKCIPWFEGYGVELKFKLKDNYFKITTENSN